MSEKMQTTRGVAHTMAVDPDDHAGALQAYRKASPPWLVAQIEATVTMPIQDQILLLHYMVAHLSLAIGDALGDNMHRETSVEELSARVRKNWKSETH